MRPFLFATVLLFASHASFGQDFRTIRFEPHFDDIPLKLDATYQLDGKDSLSIQTLRFYISSVKLLHDGMEVWAEKFSYHLLDASIPESMIIQIPQNISGTELLFFLGTDSLTNVSGAMGGDLDPSKGMYWAWNSGYINFKLEGISSASDARNHGFEFHLGGYAFPNATLQEIQLPLSTSSIIKIDIASFVKKADLKNLNHIMSPGPKAVELSKIASSIFSFSDEN